MQATGEGLRLNLFLAHLSSICQLIGRMPMVRCRQQFQTSSSRKPFDQSKTNFMWSLFGQGERKFVCCIWVTWPRWPPRPYMVKTLQKSSSPEPVNQFPRNLVCSSGDSAHHTLFKWWPTVDLDQFYNKVKFVNLGFSTGKSESCWFFHKYFSLWPETNWNNEELWVLKAEVISWPWLKVIYVYEN